MLFRSSIHNLAFYLDLVRDAREAILKGEFAKFYKDSLESMSA